MEILQDSTHGPSWVIGTAKNCSLDEQNPATMDLIHICYLKVSFERLMIKDS